MPFLTQHDFFFNFKICCRKLYMVLVLFKLATTILSSIGERHWWTLYGKCWTDYSNIILLPWTTVMKNILEIFSHKMKWHDIIYECRRWLHCKKFFQTMFATIFQGTTADFRKPVLKWIIPVLRFAWGKDALR